MSRTVARRRRDLPRGGGSVPRIRKASRPPANATPPQPQAPPPQRVLHLEVTYAQVPGELADTFEVHAEIDPKFGSLIRATAVLHAVAAMIERLELQNLLPMVYALGAHSSLSPSERDRL